VADTAGSSTRSKKSSAELIATTTAVLESVAAASGFDLEDVEIMPAGKRRVLRVVVDRDGGVDLDAVALASREFSAALDERDVMGATPYVLEVTSPGVDRPLTLPRHWRRAVGRLVEAPLSDGSRLRGRVVTADDASVTFDVNGEQRVVDLAALGDGQMQLEFDRSGGGGA
jgi:ribosome maturation factor RimP